MPLLDHFHPPLRSKYPWAGFHSMWLSALVSNLNHEVLPARFRAMPRVHVGGGIEVDVGTRDYGKLRNDSTVNGNGVATATWAPPHVTLDTVAEFADQDIFEVEVYDDESALLVAAIELVSPANKDRPSNRRDFAVKCASYLQNGISVIVVDVITERLANLHAELMDLLHVSDSDEPWESPTHLYTVAYRTILREKGSKSAARLQAWLEDLEVGSPLPTVPLWIGEEFVLPVDLESSYLTACAGLRMD